MVLAIIIFTYLIKKIIAGQIISAGWDRKINFWDARSAQSHGCLNSLASEVESISLSGFSLMVAAGSSVDIYDLRSFKKSVHTKGVKVKCVRPIFNPKGTLTKILISTMLCF